MNTELSKYATLDAPGAMSFTAISNKLKEEGISLTPARTRIVLMKSLEKIVRKVGTEYGKTLKPSKAKEIVIQPTFQNNIAPFIQKIYQIE